MTRRTIFLALSLALIMAVLDVGASPDGAPTSACETMLPGHGADPQIEADLPFNTTPDQVYLK